MSRDPTHDGYVAVRSVRLEQRVDMLDHQLLQDELIHLQRDANSGAIDHPIGGSKDTADSFAGAIWNAILTNPATPVHAKSIAKAMQVVNGRNNNYKNPMFPAFGNFRK